MPNCPVCSSDKVYCLLDTLHCKRCKNIWKEGDGPAPSAACGSPGASPGTRKRTEPLETRMEKRLGEYLDRSGGKFCLTTMTWQAGDISRELFSSYLKRCVNNRTLAETKDHYGRIWYFRLR
jgi:hypothetical protein